MSLFCGWLSTPIQSVASSSLFEHSFFKEAELGAGKAMSIESRLNSSATRAEQRFSLSFPALSSNVLTFKQAIWNLCGFLVDFSEVSLLLG